MSTKITARGDFQQLAEDRLREALVLLGAGEWHGAYYLVGYALELGLKACIIKRVMATDAFLDKDFSKNCYTHDLAVLVKIAGLEATRLAEGSANIAFEANWRTVRDWSEQVRYERVTEAEARALCDAVSDATNGVFQWVKTHW